MQSRGTGVTPGRLPSEWEKGTLAMTKESPQGPAKTGQATSRSLAPIPGTVVGALQQGDPGGFMAGVLAGRPGQAVRKTPDGDAPVSGAFTGSDEPEGLATKVTGKPVMGSTLAKGTI